MKRLGIRGRFGVISDVHANLPALEAVPAGTHRRGALMASLRGPPQS